MLLRLALLAPAEAVVIVAPTGAEVPKSTAPLDENGRLPVLLVAGSDAFHDWRRTTPQLRSLLEESGRFDVRVVEDAEALGNPALTGRYRVVVLNGQVATSSRPLRANLARFVRTGGGLVAIHWAVDSFDDWPGFTRLLGRSWREGASIEEHGSFHVVPTATGSPIVKDVAPWYTPVGEAIHYRLRGTSPIEVLATAQSLRNAEQVPVLFTHAFGRGRTVFTPLGHSAATRADPNWQRIILRSVEWAATGTVRGGG